MNSSRLSRSMSRDPLLHPGWRTNEDRMCPLWIRLSRRRIDKPEYFEATGFFAHFGRICSFIRYLRNVKSFCPMSDLTSPELAELTKFSARQIQRFACAGEIPGAYRTKGGHWRFPDGENLKLWIKITRKVRIAPLKPRNSRRMYDNYVPHTTRLLNVLRKTLPQMSDYEIQALVADTDELYETLVAVRVKAQAVSKQRDQAPRRGGCI